MNSSNFIFEIGQYNYQVILWMDKWYMTTWAALFFIGSCISMSPLMNHHEHSFIQSIGVLTRKLILLVGFCFLCLPLISLYIYDMGTVVNGVHHIGRFLSWFWIRIKDNWWHIPIAVLTGWVFRFAYNRYVLSTISGLARRLRHNQSNDEPSDIHTEINKYKVKDFIPSKYYSNKGVLVGLDIDGNPIHIPWDTWHETNMQIIGPTRYGKGVIIGCLMDQIIKHGDSLFYIDPKGDEFAPHIMYQACKDANRNFYYISLDDEGPGKWAPFAGGSIRDALNRLISAFSLDLSGDPATDYYKREEQKIAAKAFSKTRKIDSLLNVVKDSDANSFINSLENWKQIKSFLPKSKSGFSIEKALRENAVVYVHGSLDDEIIKSATKTFIVEIIQEARRLKKEREAHLSVITDEVRFLISKQLADALATAVGFGVNFVNAYQSILDIESPDDKTLNGKALAHSINVNSQIKAVYGGADFETAEWAANLSGTQTKHVTKMERTDVRDGGGEIWENQRFIGTLEENLIHPNVCLALPKRICVLKQPNQLLQACFTSFVPVKDKAPLDEYINTLLQHSMKTESVNTQDDTQPLIPETVNSPVNTFHPDQTLSASELGITSNKNKPETMKVGNQEKTASTEEHLDTTHFRSEYEGHSNQSVEHAQQTKPEKKENANTQKNRNRRNKQKNKKRQAKEQEKIELTNKEPETETVE